MGRIGCFLGLHTNRAYKTRMIHGLNSLGAPPHLLNHSLVTGVCSIHARGLPVADTQ